MKYYIKLKNGSKILVDTKQKDKLKASEKWVPMILFGTI